MLRRNLYDNIKELLEVFSKLDIYHVLVSISNGRKVSADEANITKLLEVLNQYSIEYNSFSNEKKFIIECLNLENLHKPIYWNNFISPQINMPEAMKTRSNVKFLKEHLPQLLKLLENENIKMSNKDTINENYGVLTILLPENDNKYSSAKRVSEAISSIANMYEVITEINSIESFDLTVISADSGSDKAFDFLGISKAIDSLKELILKIWDKIIYYRNDKVNANIDSIVKTLPIFDQIKSMEETKSLSPEQAELFRRKITKSIDGLLETGLIIPEMNDNSSFEPRKLMTTEQKLLTSPSDIIELSDNEETKCALSPIN